MPDKVKASTRSGRDGSAGNLSPAVDMDTESQTPRKLQILDVAARLFSEKGYRDTSMRDISEVMGLKAGSLYSHISSKDELLYRLMLNVADKLCDAAAEAEKGEGTAKERLERFIYLQLDLLREHREEITILLFEWRFLNEEQSREIISRRDAGEKSLRNILRSGVKSGEFVSGSEKWGAFAILSVTNWAHQWYATSGELSTAQIAARFSELLCDGLTPR